jgi:hypothetical protein
MTMNRRMLFGNNKDKKSTEEADAVTEDIKKEDGTE